ncbi:MAG: PAS domain S-box protein [Kiritimatiellales bacterium]|nr:PAS domain S-box protein [Kiritimatiellales bacterium]
MHRFFSKGVAAACCLLLFSSASADSIQLTSQEQAWLNDHDGVIRFASTENYPPFEFIGVEGAPLGMAIEVGNWLATNTGFTAEFYHMPLKEARVAVLSGMCDVVTCLFYSDERARDFGFTPVVFKVPASIFVPSASGDIQTLSDLNGKTVAVPEQDYAEEFLHQQNINCRILPTPSFKQAVAAVATGQADAIIGDEQVVYYYLYQNSWMERVKKVGRPLYTGQCCMAVDRTNQTLLAILSKSVERAQAGGVIDRVQRKWSGIEYTSLGFQTVRYIRYVVIGIGVLLVAVLLFWVWDIRLSRRVLEKTEQLRNSEERLRTIFQNSPDAIFIEDENGNVLDANPVACEFHNLGHNELIGRNMLDLVPEDSRNDVKRDFSKWFTGELKRYDGVSLAGDGRVVPVEIIGATMRFSGKRAVMLMVRDITQRKQSEQALKESEMRYRGLIEAQSNFIIRTDTEGTFTFVNEAFCRFVGRLRGDLIGNSIHSYIYYDDMAILEKVTGSLVSRRERVVAVEHRMRARTRTAWVQWENIAVFDESGKVVEIQSVGQDITERRRIYEALQESEKRLHFLFEEIPHIAVQGYNVNREAIFWNHASEELYGYSKKDVLGKKIEDLVFPLDQREERVKAFDDWVKTGEPIPSGEMMKRTADGRQVAVYSSRLATRNQRGEWEMYVIDVDLSELKHASEELVKAKEYAERASRAKSEFLANMSHEIRTPMNGVMGMTTLLLETELTADQRDSIQTIMESTKELMRIIDELLDISRIEAGEVRLHPEPFCMRETVEKVVLLFADRAGRKGVNLSIAIHDSMPKQLLGDSGRVRQILINLVGNALKFTHDGHIQIRMQAERDGDGWNILADVKDTGIGMTSDLQERIFDKFTQGDTSSKRKYGGAGLGLAITRQLVGLMGGKISVSSEVDKGTTFQFNLKLGAVETDVPVAVVAPVPEKPKQINAQILLVEDNLVNQKVATAMIKKTGCTVTVAPNGARALEQIALKQFDLIFMDCQMPIMDGFETTQAIRQMVGEIRDIPIVAMTAHALKEDRQKCIDAGMDDYLSKPVHMESLVAVLQKYCGAEKA